MDARKMKRSKPQGLQVKIEDSVSLILYEGLDKRCYNE